MVTDKLGSYRSTFRHLRLTWYRVFNEVIPTSVGNLSRSIAHV
jgi:hypothetical protein